MKTVPPHLPLTPGYTVALEWQNIGRSRWDARQPAESILAEVLAQETHQMRSCRLSADCHLIIAVPDRIS